MLRTTILLITAFTLFGFTLHEGGVYRSNTGNINFHSHTPIEDIDAVNHKAKSAFSADNGKIQFSVLIKDFEFEKALMQEHFNENYMESDKYPKATFDGLIEKVNTINFEKNGTYSSPVSGNLRIKDVTRKVSTIATFTVNGDKVRAIATFKVNPEDYNIDIPKIVTEKISRDIEVNVDVTYSHHH